MVAVHAGSDTYGNVKKIGDTPIVTKFAMVSAFPLYPLESFYFAGEGNPKGIPFIFTSKAIYGLPLARLDSLSVIMAYARGIFGALTVMGFFYFIFLYIEWVAINGRPPDGVALAMRYVLLVCLSIGVSGGLLTYLVPFRMTDRERQIRLACGEILGICADPAFIREDAALSVAKVVSDLSWADQVDDGPAKGISGNPRPSLIRRLVITRAKIALGEESESLESQTDDLLHRIQKAMGE
ncbi:MAG TPA: hypothetical protein VGM05_09270 [Planctomycetaceae bacterium]|jgi:hypothetical protein